MFFFLIFFLDRLQQQDTLLNETKSKVKVENVGENMVHNPVNKKKSNFICPAIIVIDSDDEELHGNNKRTSVHDSTAIEDKTFDTTISENLLKKRKTN